MKKRTIQVKLKKATALFLIFCIVFSNAVVPLANAQTTKPTDEKIDLAGKTLVTDTNDASVPFKKGFGIKSLMPSFTNNNTSNISAKQMTAAKVHKLAKENYQPNEEISLVIDNGAKTTYTTELIGPNSVEVSLDTDETVVGDTKIITLAQPSNFRPGAYTLRVTDGRGGVSEQDFSWGVLAVNPDKSVYTPGETADLAFAVLDEGGDMVCDAQVELGITNKALGIKDTLSTDNGKIKRNPQCKSHDFSLEPDYEAVYKLGGVGTYTLTLKSQTKNGTYTITDAIEVRQSVPFDVKRISATRIYPPHQYPVTMEITANQDFNGTVTETVPANFKISKPEDVIASDSAAIPSDVQPEHEIAAPDMLARNDAESDAKNLSFDTVNNLAVATGTQGVLGAAVQGVGMPFSGTFPITQEFGQNLVTMENHEKSLYQMYGLHGHDGIDFGMPEGTPLLAVDGGEVLLAGDGDYGTTVVIQHTWGRSYYGHLSEVSVKAGQVVVRGSGIGLSGNSGHSTGPHLHFGMKLNGAAQENGYYGKVDPSYYIGLKQSASQVLGASTKVSEEMNTVPSTDVQILTWRVNVKKGDKIKIGYNYLAPRISPQFYTLGPATFHDTKGREVFHEERKWQIAADALDMKIKRGTFAKSTCTDPCTQSVTGLGFKPKAIIFEWTLQTATGFSADQNMGMGLAAFPGPVNGGVQSRSIGICSEDNVATSDASATSSATRAIVMSNATDCATGSALAAAADISSMDDDGFSLHWITNNASAYTIHYTAIGGADVSKAKVGSFNLTTGTGSLAVTDPGFQPDFLMVLGGGPITPDNGGNDHAHMHLGFAAGATKEGSVAVDTEDARTTSDTWRSENTDATVLLLDRSTGATDAVANLTSFDANGFTLNKSDGPTTTSTVFYLALQGGQYDVGSLTQPTTPGEQTTTTGFKPSGVGFASFNTTAQAGVPVTSSLTLGGASASPSASAISQSSVWGDNLDNQVTPNDNANMGNSTTKSILMAASMANGPAPTTASAEAELASFSGSGFTLNWTINEVTAAAREVLYWAAGSTTATQEDYRWYRNADSITPGVALQDENHSTIISRNETGVRLRANVSAGGNGLNATSQAYKLQYAQAGEPPPAVNDWCNDTSGVTCTAPTTGEVPASTPTDWCNDTTGVICSSDWSSRRKITFNNIASSENLTNFPVLIKLDSTRVSYGKTQDSGQDIRFVDPSDKTTVLPHEIESWDENGTSYVWVKVPQIDAGSAVDSIWLYYGNASVSDGQDTDNTWDANYKAVYHMKENPATTNCATNKEVCDSSGNSNNGDSNGTMTSGDQVNAQIGKGIDFDGTDDYIQIAHSTALQTATNMTFSAWVNWTGSVAGMAYGQILEKGFEDTDDSYALTLEDTTNNQIGMEFNDSGGTWREYQETANSVQKSTWEYVTVVYDDTNNLVRFYKDGVLLQSTAATQALNATYTQALFIGRQNDSTSQNWYDGILDEIHILGTTRSADWIEAEYLSQTDGMNTYGGESSYTSVQGNSTGWPYRKKITFNNSASGTNLTDFPVLVKLDNTKIDYNKVQDAGQDIRFVDPSDPMTVLPHEIESWDENGYSYVWVKVPQIDSGSTTDSIWMYYGNSGATDGQNATGVWNDSNFQGVWHMSEDPSGASPQIQDSTSNNNDGTAGGTMTSADQVNGKVGGSLDFDAVDDIIDVGSSSVFDDMTTFTTSAWVYTRSQGENGFGRIFDKANGTDPTDGWELNVYPTNALGFYVEYTTTDIEREAANNSLSHNAWHQVTLTWNGSSTATNVKIYVDGAEVSSYQLTINGSGTRTSDAAESLKIGNSKAGNRTFDGIIDEVRVSNSVRSADWIEAEYLNQTNAMTSFGQELPFNVTSSGSSDGWTDVGDVWCNDNTGVTCTTSWTARKRIMIDNSSSNSNLTDFPILVKLDSTRIDYSKTQNSGQDIRFVDPTDPTTVLPHEIETWNESGSSYVWVKVPQLDAKNAYESIWMYYGNGSIGDGQAATSVWDSSTRSVFHMDDSAASTTVDDSTSNNLNATNVANTSGKSTSAQIGNGLNYNGTTDYTTLANSYANFTAGLTLEIWVRPTASTYWARLFEFGNGQDSNNIIFARYEESNRMTYVVVDGAVIGEYTHADEALDLTTWQHFVATQDASGNTAIYRNGVLLQTGDGDVPNNVTRSQNYLGRSTWPTLDELFQGAYDEARISTVARSADWVTADYLTQADKMNTFGEEESQTTSVWKFKANASVTDRTTITTSQLSTSTSGNQESYMESNITPLNPTAIAVGAKREWDFSLDPTNVPQSYTYYFRIVTADGIPLTNYTRYPEITVGVPNQLLMHHGKWFNYGSVQPFTF